ncbi:CLUMA_CG017216, isoform A [Clunio marinus]|uniref:CLUMA_CG017216, isoform A n=1 Tax=Clunio marinus TaxID=568069 RepID=A0A1J1IVA6_9DIPT|nr:CLUMA_CG017216, isoform A [Clunio marinus]
MELQINTYSNDLMISQDFSHAAYDKCYQHDCQHDTEHYNNNENMLGFFITFLFVLKFVEKEKKKFINEVLKC